MSQAKKKGAKLSGPSITSQGRYRAIAPRQVATQSSFVQPQSSFVQQPQPSFPSQMPTVIQSPMFRPQQPSFVPQPSFTAQPSFTSPQPPQQSSFTPQPFNTQPPQPFNAQPPQPFNTQPPQPFNAQPPQPFNAQPPQPFNAQPPQQQPPRCHHGDRCIIRQVNQIGPNNGKRFYCCPRPIDHCNFTQWIPSPSAPDPNPTLFNTPQPNTTPFNTPQQQAPRCDCGEPCALRTTTKPGPNAGRQFYVCAKPREQQCKFFVWADEVGTAKRNYESDVVCFKCGQKGHMMSACPQNQRGKRKEMTQHKTKPPTTRTARKCGLCHKEGHTRKTCPLAKQQTSDYQCDYGCDYGDFGPEDIDGTVYWES